MTTDPHRGGSHMGHVRPGRAAQEAINTEAVSCGSLWGDVGANAQVTSAHHTEPSPKTQGHALLLLCTIYGTCWANGTNSPHTRYKEADVCTSPHLLQRDPTRPTRASDQLDAYSW